MSGRGKKSSSSDVHLAGDQKVSEIPPIWGSFLRSDGFKRYNRHPSPGVQYQEDEPLSMV